MKRIDEHTSTQDMARAAARVRLAGELMESSAVRALAVTLAWQRGPRSANLEPSGGARYEELDLGDGPELVIVPSDRVGEAALEDEPMDFDYDHLVDVLTRMVDLAEEAIHLQRRAVPSPLAVLRPDDMTPAQVSAAGWCTSCWRDGNYFEPVSIAPDGTRRYRDHCLWCGRFVAANDGNIPPLVIVEARHRGERITQRMIDQAFAVEAADKKAAKAERKKNKKRKKAA